MADEWLKLNGNRRVRLGELQVSFDSGRKLSFRQAGAELNRLRL
jgi:hypothetical protein